MANFKNSGYEAITTLRTVPQNTTRTGTIATVGKSVIGTGTTFGTDVKVGEWICKLGATEIRRITSIANSTNAEIDQPFTVDIPAASALDVAPDSHLVEISFVNSGAAAALIDGISVAVNEYGGWGKNSRERESNRDFIDPVIVDGTGTTIKFLTLR